jgi:hypothetical protein
MYLCVGCLQSVKIYDVVEPTTKPYRVGGCPDCGSDVMRMDEIIAPAIIELNRKGYVTEYCCSGHMNDDYIHTYIKFKDKPVGCPKSFYIDGLCIRAKNPHSAYCGIKRFNKIIKLNRDLYEWALSLPDLNGE